jgi:hypothetical protein
VDDAKVGEVMILVTRERAPMAVNLTKSGCMGYLSDRDRLSG